MAKKKEQGRFFNFIDKVFDEGTTEEVDMENVGRRLFGRSILTGKVKINARPMKKAKR
jgi:hypothetical protein